MRGECHCFVGWGGPGCESPRASCMEQCSGHGTFLADTNTCNCDPNWTGHDCSTGQYCGHKATMAVLVNRHMQKVPKKMPRVPFWLVRVPHNTRCPVLLSFAILIESLFDLIFAFIIIYLLNVTFISHDRSDIITHQCLTLWGQC